MRGSACSTTCWSLSRETIATTGRPPGSPSAARAAARSWGGTGASTRSSAIPFGTTRSRAPGCRRRRNARATASLTAMVRSAVSPTGRSSMGEVSGIVRRVTTNAWGSRPRQRSHVSARRSRVAWALTTSTRSRPRTAVRALMRAALVRELENRERPAGHDPKLVIVLLVLHVHGYARAQREVDSTLERSPNLFSATVGSYVDGWHARRQRGASRLGARHLDCDRRVNAACQAADEHIQEAVLRLDLRNAVRARARRRNPARGYKSP